MKRWIMAPTIRVDDFEGDVEFEVEDLIEQARKLAGDAEVEVRVEAKSSEKDVQQQIEKLQKQIKKLTEQIQEIREK